MVMPRIHCNINKSEWSNKMWHDNRSEWFIRLLCVFNQGLTLAKHPSQISIKWWNPKDRQPLQLLNSYSKLAQLTTASRFVDFWSQLVLAWSVTTKITSVSGKTADQYQNFVRSCFFTSSPSGNKSDWTGYRIMEIKEEGAFLITFQTPTFPFSSFSANDATCFIFFP